MRERAVVLGASMAGLLAARVLSDVYERVTVIERDVLPASGEHRRGVPQSRHVHALLARGAQVLDELFPGLLGDLVARGVPVVNHGAEAYMSIGGHLLAIPSSFDPPIFQPSRPYLEGYVRSRVRELPNVEFIDGCDVVGPTSSKPARNVTGVRVMRRAAGNSEETLTAELVVDAMGRGGRSPAWLAELGYEQPVEDKVPIGVMYASQLVRLPEAPQVPKTILIGARPGRPTGMAIFACENNSWQFTAAGYRGHHPPRDTDAMVDFVAGLTPPEIVSALRDAEPLSDVAIHQFPANQWRRYDRLRRFPSGFLIFGDAICSFNPIYGQGMTIAALQAQALQECLNDNGNHDLAKRFFRAAARPIRVAWELGTGSDLAIPEVNGSPPLATRIIIRYIEKLHTAAERNPELSDQFLRVSGLLDAPSRLVRPAILVRVARGNLRGRRRSRQPAAATMEAAES